jgi:nucleotide-binding universal stress UspA family protein
MKQILAPLNLRSDYVNILDYVCSLASRSDASITLFFATPRRTLTTGNVLVLNSEDPGDKFDSRIKPADIKQKVVEIRHRLVESGIQYRFKFITGSPTYSIVREANTGLYDLLIMGSHKSPSLMGYLRGTLANRILSEVKTPVFVVPARTPFSGIEHISYAVDLADYDPKIIRQVKEIAALFDARLSIVHVNEEEEHVEKEKFRDRLEQTISDTLDYPKISYKFFDHADPFGGIVKYLSQNRSSILAMTSRKKFSWSSLFGGRSLTQKMAKDLQVPLLAFRKTV